MQRSFDKILILCFVLFLSFNLYAQNKISGVVKDESNKPLTGVVVMEQGTQNAVTTDSNGQFSLFVKGDVVLEFMLLGYHTVIVPIKGGGNQI